MQQFLTPIIGGVLIGIGASLLLFLNGRVFGISGIVGGLLKMEEGETAWRAAVLCGLIAAGVVLLRTIPNAMEVVTTRPNWIYVASGLLVGFGTQLGSGCTSGHGVCGISRFSLRSIVATIVFMVMGMIVATTMGQLATGQLGVGE